MSKRTGTSKAKPAVIRAPGGGAAPGTKVTSPVAASQVKRAARHLDAPDRDPHAPATGLAMARR